MSEWLLTHAPTLGSEVALGMALSVAWRWLRHPAGWRRIQSPEPVYALGPDTYDGLPAEWFDDGWVGSWCPSMTPLNPDAVPVDWARP